MTDEEAHATAWGEVRDWELLAREICKNRGDYMTDRVKAFWIPGATALLTSSLLERLFYAAGSSPRTGYSGGTLMLCRALQYMHPLGLVVIKPLFLVLLPLCGAMAAWMARRSGAPLHGRVLAATFPSLAMAACLIGSAILGLAVDFFVPGYVHLSLLLPGLAQYLVAFVIVPAISLSIGALPFLVREGGMCGPAAPATQPHQA